MEASARQRRRGENGDGKDRSRRSRPKPKRILSASAGSSTVAEITGGESCWRRMVPAVEFVEKLRPERNSTVQRDRSSATTLGGSSTSVVRSLRLPARHTAKPRTQGKIASTHQVWFPDRGCRRVVRFTMIPWDIFSGRSIDRLKADATARSQ